jgi:penicillin-binding protein 2
VVRLETRTDLHEYDHRLRVVVVLFLLPMVILLGRLWYLQIVHGDEYRRAALDTSIRTRPIPPYRGTIYDARGRVLAENRPSYDVYATPDVVGRNPGVLERLRAHLALSDDEMRRLEAAVANDERRDLRVRRDITRDQLGTLVTDATQLPGVFLVTTPHRHFPYDELAVHLLGYLGEIRPGPLERLAAHGYREGDYVGFVGLEQALEPVLRGQPGVQRFVVDARGQRQNDSISEWMLGDFQRVEPVPGRNVVLTVDMELQEILREALRGYETAAAVAVDPRDGSILAMLSQPAYDPNAWTGRLSRFEMISDVEDPTTPLFDRAIHAYFPGSTFKIVTAAAAVAEGLVGPMDTLHCDGSYRYGNRVFACNDRSGHGDINLAQALQHSCNVYFYKLGERLGIENLVQYGNAFGFGELPGSGLPNEAAGLVPSREWLEQHSPEGFQYGQVLNVSVGQGDTRTSPLQMAMAYSAVANGGTLFYPRLIDRIETAQGNILFQYPSRVRRELPFREEHLGEIVLGLTAAVNSPGGTSYASRLDYVLVAGKTGTAQTEGRSRERREPARTSAWFAGFAPAWDPQIAIVVFLEHGGGGGRNAAPIGIEIINRYFREILDYDVEIRSAVARGHTDELQGLMRLNRPGREDETFRPSGWAERYLFGYVPDQQMSRMVRQWRQRR